MDKKEWEALYLSHKNWKEFISELLENKEEAADNPMVKQIQLEIHEIDNLLKKLSDNEHMA
ncbi:hypothetical protein PP175_16740 [Aneurinibacillus sp. Ricciae_BoGa-3]|uniref:hypothetical protein n=1 Tax=Aneurinibacillus sp. Ricciae_BoGa-3 TaxID=3022697 RepID=UPI0023419B0F|nr:hypothetical protein [Aneurinibacillus sp. Ricciae_BoGa-3]WCK53048.1 hypothetical protein PP175_16740 [Aneurinibacillus sp. Ricciae_BoGa-3]